jgi:hypothetical protein
MTRIGSSWNSTSVREHLDIVALVAAVSAETTSTRASWHFADASRLWNSKTWMALKTMRSSNMSNDSGYPIPINPALRQVSHQSMQELFSRDPENLGEGGLEAIVMHMQDLRERLAKTETVRPVRVRKEGAAAPSFPQVVNSASEMGFVKVRKDAP